MRSFLHSIVVALMALVIVAGGELLLPPLVSGVVEERFAREVDAVDYIRAETKAVPSLRLLAGYADYVTVEARQLVVDELPVAALVFEARDISLNPWSLWREKKIVYQSAARLSATVILDEAGLNQYFWEKVDPEKFFRIELENDQASLVGKVSIFGRPLEVSLTGGFQVTGPAEVMFVPKSAAVDRTKIPNFLLEAVLKEKRLVLPLEKLPVPISIERVKLEDGRVLLFGTKGFEQEIPALR